MLINQAQTLLLSRFGHDGFRPGQIEVIESIFREEDLLAVMPTGSGKSLCFQLPAIMSKGLTVVISPLIALMRDQVRALRLRGVQAAMLSSANGDEEDRAAFGGIKSRRLKLLYMSPERFAQPWTLDLMAKASVRRIVVDEAHCVSHWGQDFRPDYARIGTVCTELKRLCNGRALQIIAVTATADAQTRDDISSRLFAQQPHIIVQSFDRPNIHLRMAGRRQADRQILQFIGRRRGDAGIVYCSTRRRADAMGDVLKAAGHPVRIYHAGLHHEERRSVEGAFQREAGIIVVATIAFGMGVDRADIRFVCHADTPSSIETYHQEIGRAGRDGRPAHSFCLFDSQELRRRLTPLIRETELDRAGRAVFVRNMKLSRLCRTRGCRRVGLLAHFDEKSVPCGNRDRCEENWLQWTMSALRLRQ